MISAFSKNLQRCLLFLDMRMHDPNFPDIIFLTDIDLIKNRIEVLFVIWLAQSQNSCILPGLRNEYR